MNNHLTLSLFVICLLVMSPVRPEQQLPPLGYQLNALTTAIEAPGFSLEDLDEETHSLEQYRGNVVLLNFWATWCPPCRREMPSMERLFQNLNDKAFTVIAINQGEEPDTVFSFTGQLELDPTFPMLFDRDSSIASLYRVPGLPTTYLIDKSGKIRYRAIGGREFDHPEVEKVIQTLMEEK